MMGEQMRDFRLGFASSARRVGRRLPRPPNAFRVGELAFIAVLGVVGWLLVSGCILVLVALSVPPYATPPPPPTPYPPASYMAPPAP